MPFEKGFLGIQEQITAEACMKSRMKKGRRRLVFAALLVAMMITLLGASGCGGQETGGVTTGGEAATVTSAPAAPAAATTTGTVATLPGGNYVFAVCGDNRTTGIDNGVLQKIVDSAKAHGAAFIVDTGDVTTFATRAQLERYKQFTDGAGIRFYTVPGNHDVGSGGVSQDYTDILGPAYYSFDYGTDHFMMVDNADDTTGIDDIQKDWISGDLAANQNKAHQFIFAHIPVTGPGLDSSHASGEGGSAGLESGQWLVSQADKYPDVADYFFGHIHMYIPYSLDGKKALVTGGAGAPLLPGGFYHYLLVTVKGQEVDVQVVKV